MYWIHPNNELIGGIGHQDIEPMADQKLTVNGLRKEFGGKWYYMQWAYTTADGTDYYIITKCLFDTKPGELMLPYNRKASMLFHRDVWGDALIVKESMVF